LNVLDVKDIVSGQVNRVIASEYKMSYVEESYSTVCAAVINTSCKESPDENVGAEAKLEVTHSADPLPVGNVLVFPT
jgi:hypothetical protein